jgi:hypothetical protein
MSANVSERQRRCSRSLAVHGRSRVFIVVRWCSLSLDVVGVIPNVYLRFSWRQTTSTSRSLRHRVPPGVPNQSLFWYLGTLLRSTSRRRPRRSSTTIQLPDTWPILWRCTCSLTERASVISKWLICSPRLLRPKSKANRQNSREGNLRPGFCDSPLLCPGYR